MPRCRDPQVGENYSYLLNLKPYLDFYTIVSIPLTVICSCCHFILHNSCCFSAVAKECYECTHNMVDTDETAVLDLLNQNFETAGQYNPACATNELHQVDLITCPFGCFAAHETGSLILDGKINQFPINTCLPMLMLTQCWFNIRLSL